MIKESEFSRIADTMMGVVACCNVGFISYPGDGESAEDSASKARLWGWIVFNRNMLAVFIIDMKTCHLDIYRNFMPDNA